MGGFSIDIMRFFWISDDGKDDPEDLCLHGEVVGQVGSDRFEEACSVSAAALYLLRTLDEDYPNEHRVRNQMLPCCGHAMFACEDGESVDIIGCPNGTDWTVRHTVDGLELETENGIKAIVPFEEYKAIVFAFADKVKTYYDQCQLKVLPEEDWERDGYLAFWHEWARRRQIGRASCRERV